MYDELIFMNCHENQFFHLIRIDLNFVFQNYILGNMVKERTI